MSAAACHDCGAANLDDARFCATCGVALSGQHLANPDLAALVDDATTPSPSQDPPSQDPSSLAGLATAVQSIQSVQSVQSPVEPVQHPVEPVQPTGQPVQHPAAPVRHPVEHVEQTAHHVIEPAAPGDGFHRGRAWVAPTAAVFAVLTIAAIVLVVLATQPGRDGATTPTIVPTDPSVPADSSSPAEPGTVDTTIPDPGAPSDTTAPDTAVTDTTALDTTVPDTTAPDTTIAPATADAADELAEIAAADLDRALALRERWVPQLSAKQDGTTWEGVTHDHASILELHRALDTEVGGALLVEGSSLAFLLEGKRMAGWWFTLADVDFADADGALAWCESAGFDRANCAARLVTDRDDATGTLRLRST